jgi:hypothetical protein
MIRVEVAGMGRLTLARLKPVDTLCYLEYEKGKKKRVISMTYPLTPFKSVNRLIQILLCSLFIIWNLSS